MVRKSIAFAMILLIAAVLISLAGCTKDTPQVLTPGGAVEVKVPFPVCGGGVDAALERSKQTKRPLVLPINALSAADQKNYDKVQKAYTETITILIGYIGELEDDKTEAQLQCDSMKEAAKGLNTRQPVIPSLLH